MPRNKGWFRVYDRMLDSPDILELNDSEFRVIISLWCLASQGGSEEGRIGYKNGALWRRVAPQMKKETFEGILSRLKSIGLLLGEDGEYAVKDWGKHQYLFDSYKPSVRKLKREAMSTECADNVKLSSNDCQAVVKQDTDTDSDTETDSEKDTLLVGHSKIRVPYARIVECWNRIMMPKGIPEVREMTDPRKSWMRREWVKQREGLKTVEDFEAFFQYLATKCTFMFSGTWFSFDWLFKYTNNFTKALEGNYEDGRRKK
jgi:hypothetical protein